MSHARDFQDVLTDLDEGRIHEQLTEQLQNVVSAVQETKRAGSLTLTLSIKREGDMVLVGGKIAAKVPQCATEATMFYATSDGVLTKNNPKQMDLGVPSADGRGSARSKKED